MGTFVENLAIGLSRQNVKVIVISGYPVPCARLPTKRIETYEEKGLELKIIRFPYLNMHPKNALFQLQNLKRICETVESINPDIIHGQALSTFPASIKLKNFAPLIVTFHASPKTERTLGVHSLLRGGSFSEFATNVLGYPAWSFICRNELHHSKMAVAVSRNLRRELLEEMGNIHHDKICEIHNGVDIEALDENYKRLEPEIEEPNDALLFAGRLVWGKGVLNLIKIAYLLRKEKIGLRLIVHGDGPHFKTLKKRIREFDLTNISLEGFASGMRFMRSIKRSRYVIIPSYHEACPMMLLESMCLGKIPIMFNLPFSLEFTENGKYGLVADSIQDMVEQLKNADKKSDIDSFSEKIKDFARGKYNLKNMALKYIELYKTMLPAG